MAHQVFLSHATKDADTASRVCEMLEADGVQCWLAVRDLEEGSDPAAAILEAIRTSDLVLLIFSSSANASPTVLRDIERAISYERPVLSLHLDDAVPNASLEYYLNLWQWLDASGGVEDKRDDIVAAVREQLAGTSGSGEWRWLDAPGGVDTKREELLAAVQGQLARTASSAASQEAGPATRHRPSRRTWGIIVGAALLALALGLGLGLGLTGTSHQGAWTRIDSAGTVPPAIGGMVYDPASGRAIMFGHPEPSDPFGLKDPSILDMWAYDPATNTWTKLDPAGTLPPALALGFIAYDPITRRMISFGGQDRLPSLQPDGGLVIYPTADTWAYDPAANTWAELKPSGTVTPARSGFTMAYDPTTRRLILFSGATNSDYLDDTWAYDPVANTWAELKPAGSLPPGRNCGPMVHDPSTGRMITFGGWRWGEALNDTWAYDPVANTWTDLDPSGTLPEARFSFGMVYDHSSQRVIMFGGSVADGSKYFDDTWAYDPVANTWTELQPSGTLPSARCPGPLVYDPSTGRVLMFGGIAAGVKTCLNDIWALTP